MPTMVLMSPLASAAAAAAGMGSSCDICGWFGAFMSMIGFGSFGAPIKSEASKSVDIDPLVFQTYKTMMCFVTSWLVLAFGEKLTFTPWGIVSACFWVPSGVAAIAGIKLAGLAVAMGTLSSFIVLVSFVWGIFVFDETIHSREIACLAVCLMMMGLCGMGYYSSLEHDDDSELVLLDGENYRLMDDAEDNEEATGVSVRSCSSSVEHGVHATTVNDICLDESSESGEASTDQPLSNIAVGPPENSLPPRIVSPLHNNSRDKIIIWGRPWARRQVGIACSVFCGVWGGSIMAPEKLAKADASGVGYLISFGIGAVIVTTALWMARFSYHWARFGSVSSAYQALPSFHFRVMWLPGCTAGTLWSIGNFFSLISVKYLGEGVGYSVTQSAMLEVSGLWGIFYFKEVTGTKTIAKWFLSASLTISGILLLSYEHEKK